MWASLTHQDLATPLRTNQPLVDRMACDNYDNRALAWHSVTCSIYNTNMLWNSHRIAYSSDSIYNYDNQVLAWHPMNIPTTSSSFYPFRRRQPNQTPIQITWPASSPSPWTSSSSPSSWASTSSTTTATTPLPAASTRRRSRRSLPYI